MSQTNNKKRGKRSNVSKEQQLALVKECQTSSLTVTQYAKANKIAESTLYRWAELFGVSLKPTKNKLRKRGDNSKRKTKPEWLDSKEQRGKVEAQQLPKLEIGYIIQEFLNIIKDMVKGVISRFFGKNRS